MGKRQTWSLHFWSNFDPRFPPEDDRNQKKYAVAKKNFGHGAIQIC